MLVVIIFLCGTIKKGWIEAPRGVVMRSKKVVCIIPARGGSKGIPRKNILLFCGKPLLAWSILQAKVSKYIQNVYVSSDNEEILKVAKKFGAKGIKRPPALATDTASSETALIHTLDIVEKENNRKIDLIVFLQATSPLRTTADLDLAIEALVAQRADSLFSAAILEDFCIWHKLSGKLKSMTYDYCQRGRRQDRKPLYLENGSIYVFKPEILKKYNNRLGGKIGLYLMDYWKSYEIDKQEDIEFCEYFMKKMLNQEKSKI